MITKNKKKSEFTSRFLLWFAAADTAICFTYIFLITFSQIPKGNERFADVCLGFLLGTFLATILQFYYGSSHNATKKDNPIHEDTESKNTVVAVTQVSTPVDTTTKPTEDTQKENTETK